jgi:hypothetical protein
MHRFSILRLLYVFHVQVSRLRSKGTPNLKIQWLNVCSFIIIFLTFFNHFPIQLAIFGVWILWIPMDTLHFSAIARSESGLGGRWGPYRLDMGQKLVQVSEDAKQGLDEATKRKTQEMADAAYRQRQSCG